jgi:hypothetical protein
MAEQEVIKHTKKVYKIWNNQQFSFWHKLKEFFIEIAIIVFAVSLSIWLHSLSEHRHEQKEVKKFLRGLKEDIVNDIAEAKRLLITYKNYDIMYTWLYSLKKERSPDKDTLHTYLQKINSNAFLRPNITRFNGFLSAGKIGAIESDSLALNILYLYQETVPRIKSSETAWLSFNKSLNEYIIDNVKDADSDKAKWEVLIAPKAKILCKSLIPWKQLYERYEEFILQGEAIMLEIDKAYPALN